MGCETMTSVSCFSLIVLVLALTSSTSLSFRPMPLPDEADLMREFGNHTAISSFRTINRRELITCPIKSPYLAMNVSMSSSAPDEGFIYVTLSGVLYPASSDWIAMISPSTSDVKTCITDTIMYKQTGDLASLPLLCHYPVKAQYLSNDPNYLSCANSQCQDSSCLIKTCSGTLKFHYVNMRTDMEFVSFADGFDAPCILTRTNPVPFANPSSPLRGHLSSMDSTGTSMKLRWISGDQNPQQLQYANGQTATSNVTTFTQNDMCTSILPSPAKDFGWHDPGYIHTAVMTGLQPSTTYTYTYGSSTVGFSNQTQFKTPPAGGSPTLTFLAFGDMGKTPLDASAEHYIQPGAVGVIDAMTSEVQQGGIDAIFHIGDIAYATGFLVEWDYFLTLITPIASQVTYMTAIGNHERSTPSSFRICLPLSLHAIRGMTLELSIFRDYIGSGAMYITPDSGGECGVPYETYFPMPTPGKDKPWYSIEMGPVHFTVISTEHDWRVGTEQYNWIQSDLASVNRANTPWLIFAGHRPMYTSIPAAFLNADARFTKAIEPLLLQNKVDLAIFGHVHNYERLCAVYGGQCLAMPVKDANGIDTYNNSNYSAPVQAVIGMAGFKLDGFVSNPSAWSLSRISAFGYTKCQATTTTLNFKFINANTEQVMDQFNIVKQ
ncbi:putative inactive purple acid phosphatase 24 [Drosera capensis]